VSIVNRMSESEHSKGGHRRHGRCHRCGWSQDLRKVTIRRSSGTIVDKAENLVRGAAWLCDECATELTGDRSTEKARPSTRANHPSRSTRDRVVA